MFLLLQVALRSWRLAGLVFLTLPAAVAGGVLASLLDGSELSLGALAGLVAIFAVAARASLLLVTRLQRLGEERDAAPGAQLVGDGAREQLMPILAATLATMAILLPFALRGGDVAGLEIVSPMALVMLGGLVATALVTLFAVPALYLRYASAPEPVEDLTGRRPAAPSRGAVPAQPAPAPAIVVNPEVVEERIRRRRFVRGAGAGNDRDAPQPDVTADDEPTAPAGPPAQAS
jgi:predicted exporter